MFQCEVIVRVLFENEEDYLSVEDVYFFVKEKFFEIGFVIVYCMFELLIELKVVDKINFGDGVFCYDFCKEGVVYFYYYLVCMECGVVDEIEEDLFEDVEEIIECDWKFKIKDYRLMFYGICYCCNGKEIEQMVLSVNFFLQGKGFLLFLCIKFF